MAVLLGANLPVVYDWQGTNIFSDIIKQSRGFSSYDDPSAAQNIATDADGIPLEPFGLVVKAPLSEGDAGVYRLRYKGRVVAEVMSELIQITEVVTDGTWTNAVLNIPPEALAWPASGEPALMLRFYASPGGPVSEISLVKQDLIAPDGSFPTFHPIWVEHLRRFKVIRFMNWMSFWLPMPEMDWSDRPRQHAFTQAGNDQFELVTVRGVAPEYIVELSNLLGCDVWINIPPLATDDYIRGLATLLKTGLATTAKVYVEYGNEIWAVGDEVPACWQGNRNRELAVSEVLAGGSNLMLEGETERTHAYAWAIRRYARRTKEAGDIFGSVFKTSSRKTRIRPVFCYQSVNPAATLDPGLAFLERVYGKVEDCIWGIAPKTGLDEGPITDADRPVTKAWLLEKMKERLQQLIGGYPSVDATTPLIEQGLATAAWHNIAFAGYEGGIGVVSVGASERDMVFDMMQHEWEIYNICYTYLMAWYAYGNDNLLCWFIAGASDWRGKNAGNKPDIHGLSWNITQQNTYPIQALDDILQRNEVPLAVDTMASGNLDTRRHVERNADWSTEIRNNRIWQANGKFYLLNSPTSKQYTCKLVSEMNSNHAVSVEIWVNRVKSAVVLVPNGKGAHTSAVFKIRLRKGANALKLLYAEHASGNYYLEMK